MDCTNCTEKSVCQELCDIMENQLPGENDGDIMDYDNSNHVVVRYDSEDELDFIIQTNGLAEPQSTLCDQGDISALESFGFTDLQKKIVKMKYFDGLPVDQISIKVRLHPSTINDSLESIKRKVQNAFIKWSIWKDLSNIDWHAEYEKVTGRKYKHAGELGQIAEMFYKNLMSPPTIASILNSDPATVRKKIKKIQKILANL